jgi:hypothetical protein
MVYIDMAGTGTRRIRLANLPPEVSDRTIWEVLTVYEEVKEINKEFWSNAYRYPVSNGIRTAIVHLKKHLPSHVVIAGIRVLIFYDGQPPTCYACNEQGHLFQNCPRCRTTDGPTDKQQEHSWANVVDGRQTRQQGVKMHDDALTKPQPQMIQMTQIQDTMTQIQNDTTNARRENDKKEGMDTDHREQDETNTHNYPEHQREEEGNGNIHSRLEINEMHKDRMMT